MEEDVEIGVEEVIESFCEEDLKNFLYLGAAMVRADKDKPWDEEGLTKSQWLASRDIPASMARQAGEATKILMESPDFETTGLTVGKLKLILPLLKKTDDIEEKKAIFMNACNMLYNDLRDELAEKRSSKGGCKEDEWEHKEYWRCPKNGKRIYVDPTIKN